MYRGECIRGCGDLASCQKAEHRKFKQVISESHSFGSVFLLMWLLVLTPTYVFPFCLQHVFLMYLLLEQGGSRRYLSKCLCNLIFLFIDLWGSDDSIVGLKNIVPPCLSPLRVPLGSCPVLCYSTPVASQASADLFLQHVRGLMAEESWQRKPGRVYSLFWRLDIHWTMDDFKNYRKQTYFLWSYFFFHCLDKIYDLQN